MKKFIAVLFVFVIVFGLWLYESRKGEKNEIVINNESASTQGLSQEDQAEEDEEKIMNATLHTNKGDIVIEFFESQTPNTVANFTKLAKEGFYNGTKFHRVIKGFMIQGGDPLTKDDSKASLWGTGGPGYSFPDELGGTNTDNKNDVGTISMANSGANTNGSQFFINVASNNFLDAKHVVFGKVVSGMDIVSAIENTPTGEADRPISPVIIESVSFK
jgi:peptidylprolyl isomerase